MASGKKSSQKYVNAASSPITPAETERISLTDRLEAVVKAIDSIQDITNKEKKRVVEWLKETFTTEIPKLRIVTVGEKGVGKSSLLNALVGTKKFDVEQGLAPGSCEVKQCLVCLQGIEITVYDCPGLQSENDSEEEEYLTALCKMCTPQDTDLLLYCMRMDETRKAGHTKAIETTTKFYGKEIWEHAVVVLTFANLYLGIKPRSEVPQDARTIQKLDDRIKEWKDVIEEKLKSLGVERDTIEKLQVLPAGHNKNPKLPGREYWLSDLWAHTLLTIRKEKQSALLAIGGLERGFQSEEEAARSRSASLTASLTGRSASGRDVAEQPIVLTPAVKSSINEAVGPEAASVFQKVKNKLAEICTIL